MFSLRFAVVIVESQVALALALSLSPLDLVLSVNAAHARPCQPTRRPNYELCALPF